LEGASVAGGRDGCRDGDRDRDGDRGREMIVVMCRIWS